MAKATVKSEAPALKKSPAKTKAKGVSGNLEKVSVDVLDKLKSINADQQLQADLEWCLGSYRYDQNPSGLITAIQRAHAILKEAQSKKTKGVTATLISNIEKVLN